MNRGTFSRIRILTILLIVLTFSGSELVHTASATLYKTPKGTLKDNCVVWHDGTFYLMTMYRENLSGNDLNFKNMWLATSTDGVHWEDRGPVIHNAPFPIWAIRVWKVGDRFIMNHGSWTPSRQAMLRFWESKDLVNWKYLGKEYDVLRPDGKRIDHMDVVSIDSDQGKQWYGYAAGGLLRSEDGVKWKWKEDFRLANQNWAVGETGGCRQIGGKFYLLGGNWQDPRLPGKARGLPGDANYNVLTFVADGPEGPFRPDYPALRLNGNSGSRAVAVWASYCQTPDELLLVNYIADPHAPILWWHAPLKKAVVDKDGHLRTGYWKGNETIKGKLIPIQPGKCEQVFPPPGSTPNAAKPALAIEGDTLRLTRHSGKNTRWFGYDVPQTAVAMLGELFDPQNGFVLEGRIKVDKLGFGRTSVGLFFEEQPQKENQKSQKGMAALLHTHRLTEIGPMHLDNNAHFDCDDRTGFGCATVTGIDAGKTCSFRLLFRKDVFELYLDDMLVQTYYVNKATGRIGLVVRDGQATFNNLKAWQMNLEK